MERTGKSISCDETKRLHKEAFERAAAISHAQGGTMLAVMALSNEGLSRIEISRILHKSYQAVVASEHHLKRWGLIRTTRSVRERARLLEGQIRNLPDGYKARQQLIEQVPFGFYRDHQQFFVTTTQCIRLAGFWLPPVQFAEAAEVLKGHQIALKTYEMKEGHYRIQYRAERERAVQILQDVFIKSRVHSTNPS